MKGAPACGRLGQPMPAIPAVRAMHVHLRGITEQHGRGVAVPKLLSASRAFNSIRVRLIRPLVYFSKFRVVLFQRPHNAKDNLCYSEMTQVAPHPAAAVPNEGRLEALGLRFAGGAFSSDATERCHSPGLGRAMLRVFPSSRVRERLLTDSVREWLCMNRLAVCTPLLVHRCHRSRNRTSGRAGETLVKGISQRVMSQRYQREPSLTPLHVKNGECEGLEHPLSIPSCTKRLL